MLAKKINKQQHKSQYLRKSQWAGRFHFGPNSIVALSTRISILSMRSLLGHYESQVSVLHCQATDTTINGCRTHSNGSRRLCRHQYVGTMSGEETEGEAGNGSGEGCILVANVHTRFYTSFFGLPYSLSLFRHRPAI